MRSTFFALAAALSLAAPAAGAVSDFRLPPSPTETQPPPDRQGPVAPDVPESRRPAPTPTPTATVVAPPVVAPTVTPPPVVVPPATTTGGPERQAQSRERVVEAPAATVAEPASLEPADGEALELPSASASPTFPSPASRPLAESAGDARGPGLLWGLIALAGLAAAVLLGVVYFRRTRSRAGAPAVPQIERPRLAPAPSATPATGGAEPGEPLRVALEPLRMSLTLLNATLAYRLEITNRGASPLTGLSIGADMISAHASISREEQLAGPGAGAAPLQRIERLAPGESRVVSGEFRVPFSDRKSVV